MFIIEIGTPEYSALHTALAKYAEAKRTSLNKCTIATIGDSCYAEGYINALTEYFKLDIEETPDVIKILYSDGTECMRTNY